MGLALIWAGSVKNALLAAMTALATVLALSAASRAQDLAASELARRLGCFACHGDGQGHPAPSLHGIGTRLTREQLQLVLTQPRRLYPGAKMPSYAYLPEGERRALVDFLGSLKDEPAPAGRRP